MLTASLAYDFIRMGWVLRLYGSELFHLRNFTVRAASYLLVADHEVVKHGGLVFDRRPTRIAAAKKR